MKTIRRRLVRFTCTAAAAGLVVLAPLAQGSPAVAAAVPRAPAAVAAGASDITDLGARGWEVQSSAVATQSGARISTPGFGASGWLPVRNDDAGAPGTEIEALVQNGKCPGDTALQPVNQNPDGPGSIYFSDNLKRCYGSMNKVGADTVAEFDVPWWWRTDFAPHLRPGQTATLIVNGVIGSANVWVNGHEVGTSATVTGAYTRFRFSVGSLAVSGTNSLAIEVNPNNPNTMFTLDDVDWNQIPPDNNTGIESPVQLEADQALTDGNARVVENNAADLSSSGLSVKSDITNNTSSSQTGTVAATITPPGGGAPVTVSQQVTVPANTTKTVSFTPSAFPGLTIMHPRAWWPYQLGAQPLYKLATSVSRNGTVLDSTSEAFGIRTVTSYLTGANAAEPKGARAFKINGVPIVIRGGGFSPNLLLRYSLADTARQIALMKNMGLNTIRLEGHLMPADFYQQMDQAGILVNAGFQCCDAWELQSSGLTSPADYAILQNSATAIAQDLTNAGGSWGYDSEQSAGDTIPTMDSLNRFMSPSDLSSLWQNPDANQYHLNYENSCSLSYTFGTACKFDAAMNARYGKPSSLAQYVEEAQAQDYEDVRAQFEAFIDHANNTPLPSTGTIYWQMNKGLPSLLWNLYGSDGDQAGSYFGAQEANRPLHALYALDNGTVTLDNLSNAT